MAASQTATVTTRPFADLLHPETDRPLSARPPGSERRQHPRYSRCLLGQMLVEGRSLTVACVDVSIGGAQVVTPDPCKLPPGSRVKVNVQRAGWEYQDEFTVVATNEIRTGTAVHLKR